MKELYRDYINSKRGMWSEASIRSEELRLNKILHLINGDAPMLWKEMGLRYSKHSRVTTWNRVVSFVEWAVKNKRLRTNPYAMFRDENPQCFRGFYVRKPPTMTFADTQIRIMSISDVEIRNKLLQLLTSGMRWSESFTITDDGYVTGKGGKGRRVYPMKGLGPMAGPDRYRAVVRQCHKIGLKGPHRCRGIFLSEFIRIGGNTFELKAIAGWSSVATAESYIAVNEQKVGDLASKIHEGVTV